MEFTEIIQVLALLVAGTGVYLGLRGVQRQMWIAIFGQYTQRYASIMDSLPPDARSPHGSVKFEQMEEQEKNQVLNVARRYLNLCSEERFLASSKHLDKKAWKIWKTGIRDTARLPFFVGAWEILKPEYSFYPDFQQFIDEMAGPNA